MTRVIIEIQLDPACKKIDEHLKKVNEILDVVKQAIDNGSYDLGIQINDLGTATIQVIK